MSTDWPFDPVSGELAVPPPSNLKELTVSELSFALKRTLEENFGLVRVRGEISKVSRPGSGHCYLDLKDDRSVICAVIWKTGLARFRFKPEPGLEVVITGRIPTFPAQSRYQIVIDSMEPAGAGALMALLDERRKKLRAEGLFDVAHKKPIPFLPGVIGIVTSPTGAVIRDILHRLADRFPRHVLVWPVRVQGDRSAEEVTAAIQGFNALRPGGDIPRPDLIIVARGGGSIEDLWSFNEENVVRAAARSAIPLIAAIGHETDWTLIDDAADWRAPTPTAAAERAVPVRADLALKLATLQVRSVRGLQRFAGERRTRVLAASRGLPRPDDLLASARQRFDSAADRLSQALRASTLGQRIRLQRVAPRLSLGPVQRETLRHRQTLQRLGRQGQRAVAAQIGIDRHTLEATTGRLLQSLRDHARRRREILQRLMPRLSLGAVEREALRRRATLDRHGREVRRAMANLMALRRTRLGSEVKLLTTLSHRSVLGRGYALVMAGSRLVSSLAAARPGLVVTIRFHDGDAAARIDGRASPGDRPRGKEVAGQKSLF
ncbi:MAG: exodeoxyribonuclease VII large subunit [Pseudomonadota bacterium]|nr:exodeoxyribonuclease VII large subunit [Pseudomonadota bacterium]